MPPKPWEDSALGFFRVQTRSVLSDSNKDLGLVWPEGSVLGVHGAWLCLWQRLVPTGSSAVPCLRVGFAEERSGQLTSRFRIATRTQEEDAGPVSFLQTSPLLGQPRSDHS